MPRIYAGTCSWVDKSLIGPFYPEGMKESEMLSYYARHFPVVEIDSTFYRMPNTYLTSALASKTPDHFVFHTKAFGPMTGHSGEWNGEKVRKATEDMLLEFQDAFSPLAEQGKLGYILFQFPKWFFPSTENKDYIAWCAEILRDSLIAVEFRNGYWFKTPERTEETLEFLSDHGIVYTSVDELQVDIKSSVPLLDAATTKEMAILRLHGRKSETWDVKGVSVQERFDYNYSDDELASEIVPRVKSLAENADEVHVMFNNVHNGYGPGNAKNLMALLAELGLDVATPERAAE